MTTTKNLSTFLVLFAIALFAVAGIANADILNRSLDVGMSGTDVSAVQTFLAKDVTLYPQGLVTGYYGFLTKSAVSNFQSRNGIDPVGRVGPITRGVLNAQMAGGSVGGGTTGGVAPTIFAVTTSTTVNSAIVNWNTNEGARGVVYYSSSPLSIYERVNSADVSGNTAMTDVNYRTAQSVMVQGLSPNTTYYYMIYTTDQDGNVSVTWPSTFRTTN
jgi:peptidoglycan hydrolase-like protein with peptidoglycan-binding domain